MKEYIIKVDDPGERAWDGGSKVFETKELIRCKNCKHSHRTYDGMTKFCDLIKDENDMMIELYRPGDWYCADGERSE